MDGWPRSIFLALEWLWAGFGLSCFAAALIVVLRPKALSSIESYLQELDRGSLTRRLPLLLFGIGAPFLVSLDKIAQYQSFLLGLDTGVMGNAAWRLLHGYGWTASLYAGVGYLAIHFAFTVALLSPVLWLWPNVLALVLLSAVAVGSLVYGVYLLGRLHCRLFWAAGCLALLALSHPFFHSIAVSFLDNAVFAAPLFVWGIYSWESGQRKLALALAVLLLTTKEQAPLLFLGLGLLIAARSTQSRGRLVGFGLATGSLILFAAEILAIQRARSGLPANLDRMYWGTLYASLGGTPSGIVRSLTYRPWILITALFQPLEKLWVVARTLLSFALLPLAAGIYLLPAAVAWLPHQLSDTSGYYSLAGHYPSFIFGPLLWSAALGLRRMLRDTSQRIHRYIAAFLLAVSGCGFFTSCQFVPTSDYSIIRPWRHDAPQALAAVPPLAKVWCDDMLAPQLSMRPYIKFLPHSGDYSYFFENGLFVPDRVVLSRRWMGLAERATRERILRFLAERRFAPISSTDSFVVMANPSTSGDGSEPVVWEKL